uniref:HNH endonuclease n=3 Tax=uncultured Brachyspira sp. TaxID=221953 RepID=UPI0026305E02
MEQLYIHIFSSNVRTLGIPFALPVFKEQLFNFFKICGFDIKEVENNNIEYQNVKKITKTDIFTTSLTNFISKYYSNYKRFYQLVNVFINFKNDEDFFMYLFISENKQLGEDKLSQISTEMISIINNSLGIDDKYFKEKTYNITNDYDCTTSKIYEYTNKHTYEIENKGKKCKYCDKSGNEYFNKKAHIVPESLNGHLLDSRECDICNGFFGSSIELDLIRFLDPLRALLGISGKNGIPEVIDIYGNKIISEFNNETKIREVKMIPSNDITEKNFIFKVNVNFHNLYKSLVKIALGIIKEESTHIFSKTINWIKLPESTKKIPPLIYYYHNRYIHRPCIDIYISKKTDNIDIPYSFAMLHIQGLSFIYLIPTFNEKKDFSSKINIECFIKNYLSFLPENKYLFINCNENKERITEYEFYDNKNKNMKIKINKLIPVFDKDGNIYEKYANKQKQRPKELSSPTRCPITQ